MLKKAVFYLLTAVLAVLVVEGFGYGLFFLKYGESPRAFGARMFVVPRLIVPDHPYLPFGTRGGEQGVLRFNSWGDRGPEPEVPKRRTRILCFGGSTTFDGEHRWEETWPGYLQELLGAGGYEVISVAQDGDTTADTLVKLALSRMDLEPDLVLVYHGTNDLESSYARGFKSDYSHRRRDVGTTPYPFFDRLPRWLELSSAFVAARHALLGDRGELWQLYTRREARYDFAGGPVGLATFRRNLASLNAICRERGAKVVLGTFVFYKPWAREHVSREFAEAWERGIGLENEIVRDLAERDDNVWCAEVATAFTPTEEHMLDFCHLKPSGNRLVAGAFREAVAAALRPD